MDIISNLKLRRDAARDCINSEVVEEKDKEQLRAGEQLLDYSYYISKGIIASGFIFLVNWRKQVPITKREIPLSFLAFALCFGADYATN